MPHVRIFLSAVSDEFRSYRELLAQWLKRPDLSVQVQEDFIPSGSESLEELDNYIKQCEAVIHIVGDMTGRKPRATAVKSITQRYSDLEPLGEEEPALSYTQWEAFLALQHRKTLIIAIPAENAPRDAGCARNDQEVKQQNEHLSRLRKLGRYPGITFNSPEHLAIEVLRSKIQEILPPIRKPSNLIYQPLGNLFKGRTKDLKQLSLALDLTVPGGATAIVAHDLRGLGGIGKTRLACEYGHRHAECYTALLFVNADTPDILRASFSGLADPVVLDLPEHNTNDADKKITAVLHWLASHPLWFLIIDNIDDSDAAEAAQKILMQLKGGHVLMTGRFATFAAGVKTLELGLLNRDDAAAYLLESTAQRRRAGPRDETSARQLAEELGDLPLMLEQAAAWINRQSSSFERYLETWRTSRKQVLEWFNLNAINYHHRVAIATTWQSTFVKLTGSAKGLLERIAWLAPERIPESLLDVPVPDTETTDHREAIAELAEYSLVTRALDEEAFSVHRLVQDVTRLSLSSLSREAAQRRLGEAVRWVDAAVNKSTGQGHKEQLTPHLLSVLHFLHQDDFRESDTSEFLDPLARLVVLALLHSGSEQTGARKIIPEYLATILGSFYEVDPLSTPIKTLLKDEAWPRYQEQLLSADNYVLRYAMAVALADVRAKEQIVPLIDERRGLNKFELGGYALCMIYARDPGTISIPCPYLERLANHPAYPGRSILGDLFLNLVFRPEVLHGRNLRDFVASDRFWDPIWDFVQLDVWAIEAAEAFIATPRRQVPVSQPLEVRQTYNILAQIEMDLGSALESVSETSELHYLLTHYFSLGQETTRIRDALPELASRSDLLELMRLFFAHPIWAVAEAAATVLSQIAQEDPQHLQIISRLLSDDNWRVRFGANEAAFAVRHVNRAVFCNAVHRFYDDPNCKIRGLCAENLGSVILNSGGQSRERWLHEFEDEVRYWLHDTDCWVLEHVFRLFHTLEKRGVNLKWLLPKQSPPLLEGQPQWYRLDREPFLRHIEQQKEKLVTLLHCAESALHNDVA
jgi:hypothetical protein